MDNISEKLKWINPIMIIGYGSKYTGIKKGITAISDIDLIIVSNFFSNMCHEKRKNIISGCLGEGYDTINITMEEFVSQNKKNTSIVNIALKEGVILYES